MNQDNQVYPNNLTGEGPMSDPGQHPDRSQAVRGLVLEFYTPILIGPQQEVYQRYPTDCVRGIIEIADNHEEAIKLLERTVSMAKTG